MIWGSAATAPSLSHDPPQILRGKVQKPRAKPQPPKMIKQCCCFNEAKRKRCTYACLPGNWQSCGMHKGVELAYAPRLMIAN